MLRAFVVNFDCAVVLSPEEKILKKKNRPKLPIEKKESFRWLEGWRETIKAAKRNENTSCVCIGDSESDIFEVFAEPRVENAHLLVRACRDRNIENENKDDAVKTGLFEATYASPIIATKMLSVRARPAAVPQANRKRDKARTSREAFLETRKTTLSLKAPIGFAGELESVTLNVVLVSEANPPIGETPVEWLLLTTLPIETLEDVLKVIGYYESRWIIEIFFKTLKSGCKVESLQFEETSRLEPCLGVYLIVAWRVLLVCRLGRSALLK